MHLMAAQCQSLPAPVSRLRLPLFVTHNFSILVALQEPITAVESPFTFGNLELGGTFGGVPILSENREDSILLQ